MDLERRFKELGGFINSHLQFINEEPLNFCPHGLPSPYREWTGELANLRPDELVNLETNLDFSKADGGLREFYKKIKELGRLPSVPAEPVKLNHHLTRGMTEKKRHEISLISGFLKDQNLKTFLDVGSGKGHLSMGLLQDREARSYCVDTDRKLQDAGLKKLKDYLPEMTSKIAYENARFHKSYRPLTIDLILALHSCGDLSIEAMEYALNNNESGFLNFACCYHKLTKLNLSKASKKVPLKFSFQALNLATRSHRRLTTVDTQRREKVKRFRYAFHALSLEDGHEEFVALGNANHRDYEGEFSSYCEKYAPWKLAGNLNDRFAQLEKKKTMQEYLLAESIRGPLGRLVEIYLILDRALWLKEFGKNPQVGTLFGPEFSPRNIMIYFRN